MEKWANGGREGKCNCLAVDQVTVQVILILILWLFSVLSSGFITDALGYQMLPKENGTVRNVKIK